MHRLRDYCFLNYSFRDPVQHNLSLFIEINQNEILAGNVNFGLSYLITTVKHGRAQPVIGFIVPPYYCISPLVLGSSH